MIIKIGRALHKRAKGEKGFTLIELIVVIAVLGVLATLVVPKVVNIKANDGLNKLVTENYLDDIPDKVKSGTWSYTLNSDGKSYELK